MKFQKRTALLIFILQIAISMESPQSERLEKLQQELTQRQEEIGKLRMYATTRRVGHVWTTYELQVYAPYYRGGARKFDWQLYIDRQLSLHIAPIERRIASITSNLKPEVTARFKEVKRSEEEARELASAVRKLFHVACPHPIHFRSESGEIDIKSFESQLKHWVSAITAVWRAQHDSGHRTSCECCLTFRGLATNYEDMCQAVLSEDDYNIKRVDTQTIVRWANALSDEQHDSAFRDLLAMSEVLETMHATSANDHTLDGAVAVILPVTSLPNENEVLQEDDSENTISGDFVERFSRGIDGQFGCEEQLMAINSWTRDDPTLRTEDDGECQTASTITGKDQVVYIPIYNRSISIRINPRGEKELGREVMSRLYSLYVTQYIRVSFWMEKTKAIRDAQRYSAEYHKRRKLFVVKEIEYENQDYERKFL